MQARDFKLSMDWLDFGLSSPEEAVTAGMLKICLKNACASRHYDLGSKTLIDYAKVSAYPMALWLAYYWWRLNYEPYSGESYQWKSAHDLPAAGDGYVWPPLRIVSNGESVSMRIIPPAEKETLADAQYTASAWGLTVPKIQFELEAADFINMVTARLADTGHTETELHTLWQDVCRERQNSNQKLYRILEACLGHNPDEGPEVCINKLADIESMAGRSAVIEIAAGLPRKTSDFGDIFDNKEEGVLGKFHYQNQSKVDKSNDKPWTVGHRMALELRKHLGLNGGPIHDKFLADFLDIPASAISSEEIVRPLSQISMSLGLPTKNGSVRFCLHHPVRQARRFYLARLLGEHLLNTGSPNNWLTATFGATWRQKYQRAFASEFLCPIEVLEERLNVRYDDYEIDAIAQDYGMGTAAVINHWESNQPKSFDRFEDKYAH